LDFTLGRTESVLIEKGILELLGDLVMHGIRYELH
jgi:hypothetical protein